MRIIHSRVIQAAVTSVAAVVLAGCGSGSTSTATSPAARASESGTMGASPTTPVPVVTSTNVWGDIVAQIGGEQVAATSVITDPSADPHSFEPNAQAQLLVSKAELIVMNGGGYDDWMTVMVDASKSSAPVLDAVEISGKDAGEEHQDAAGSAEPSEAEHEHGAFNEHVWYDFPTVALVAEQMADELSTLRPDQAEFFRSNADAFGTKLEGLSAKVDDIKAAHDGAEVAITEPVPLYLTEAAGLVNKTPDEFSEAIEEGTDVPPAVLADTLAMFTGKQVVSLIYNEQTSSPETEKVLSAATDSGIGVVPVTETLPAGKDYLSWMDANVTLLAAALGR